MNEYHLYEDIALRTKGEIYLGVVGPVRTGKSTFIKRFMDLCVIPAMEDSYEKEQAIDELPQSAPGKTIMTTEPKFIPKAGATLTLGDHTKTKVRLIDCVGFYAQGAVGNLENNRERFVKTPWFQEEIPFSKGAAIGTEKVIREHATVGVVVTGDGSFGELPREAFEEPESRCISLCKEIGKPFVILMNSAFPGSEACLQLCEELKEKYQKPVIPMQAQKMQPEDMNTLLESILLSFPVQRIAFYVPPFLSNLQKDHKISLELKKLGKKLLEGSHSISDLETSFSLPEESSFSELLVRTRKPQEGLVEYDLVPREDCYLSYLSDCLNTPLEDEYDFYRELLHLTKMKQEYNKIKEAWMQVEKSGYGVVIPKEEEITIEPPELIRHGGQYGIKIKASAPSIHLIQTSVDTEIAPMIGTEEQTTDLLKNMEQEGKEAILATPLFGKTIQELIQDGISSKAVRLGEEGQWKLQQTMNKVVNDSNGGFVCIIL